MDAIVGVWLTSLLGATAFSAAGYVLGQRGVVLPLLGSSDARRTDEGTTPAPAASLPPAVLAGDATGHTPSPQRPSIPSPAAETQLAPPIGAAEEPREGLASTSDDDDGRPTVVPDTSTQAAVVAATVATSPPPDPTSIRVDPFELETTKADLQAALAKAESSTQRARAAEAVKAELERRVEELRDELRNEVVARATASARADELGDRLASASEEASSLRHKVSVLDKQSRQLREALQGRVRALTTSEWHRRRDLEEAEEIRAKLRNAYEKLERSSLPPPASGSTPSMSSPSTAAPPRSVRPDGDGDAALREENARLTSENRALRARLLGSMTPKKVARGSVPDLDIAVLREIVDHAGSVAGLKSVVVADETGSLVVGSGDLAEGMAAFGAYIRDASSRTDRLLPLEGVEEVDIRDRRGMVLSTRVVPHSASELCLVLLGSTDGSLVAAKKVVEEQLRPHLP